MDNGVMLQATAWGLGVIDAGVPVLLLGLACHAWELAARALERVERLERDRLGREGGR